jgi:hypothetical protein
LLTELDKHLRLGSISATRQETCDSIRNSHMAKLQSIVQNTHEFALPEATCLHLSMALLHLAQAMTETPTHMSER